MGLGSRKKERGKEGVGKSKRDNKEDEWGKRRTAAVKMEGGSIVDHIRVDEI